MQHTTLVMIKSRLSQLHLIRERAAVGADTLAGMPLRSAG
ncbi:hypothetical protein ABIF68_002503 [Bradyrhizobium japonicum]|jgi:hypothetical protein